GVEELPRESARIAASSIHRVANDREMRVSEMHADLVRASGDRLDVQKRGAVVAAAPGRDPLEAGHRVTPAGADDHAPPVLSVAEQRRLDDSGAVTGVA